MNSKKILNDDDEDKQEGGNRDGENKWNQERKPHNTLKPLVSGRGVNNEIGNFNRRRLLLLLL